MIRRYFRGYLHCWKTVLHFVRDANGLKKNEDWKNSCERWQTTHLDKNGVEGMEQLRETRDYDTHAGTIVVMGEVAAGLFPLVFIDPVKTAHVRRELVTLTRVGLEVAGKLIATHATFN